MGEIKLVTNILKSNEECSDWIKMFLKEKGIYTINLMSSPGAGKTSILERVIKRLKEEVKIAVIEGDIYTVKDAERIEAQGVEVVQINTKGACHLDGNMIKAALNMINLEDVELLIIENVGNLVCPAEFSIGEDMKIAVLSVVEGNDKPLKYPLMFEKSEAIILNKIDLIPYTNFSVEEFYNDIKNINSKVKVFETSCQNDEGFEKLCEFIKERMNEKIRG